MTRTRVNLSPLAIILGMALIFCFSIRIAVRVVFGQDYFWKNSYLIYYALAQNVVSGNGFCLDSTCAWLPPLYPLLLTLSVIFGHNYLFIVVPQALLGAGTALFAFMIARQVFCSSVGILACIMTACYPYYVMHDTALQETGMVTFCTALAVWLLLRASNVNREIDWFLAGMALGAATLIRVSMAPAAGVGLLWCAVWGASGDRWVRLRKCVVLLVAVIAVIGPWLTRTYFVTGAPVLTSQTGIALWTGNNPSTFSRYPTDSIDRSREQALLNLSEKDRADLQRLGDDENARSRWFAHRAIAYIWENPLRVLQGMFRKIDAAFSWRLSPYRGPLPQAIYSIAYVPVAILGSIGMFLARRQRKLVILIGMLFIAFVCVTAIFWAHTSHRSYLDVYGIVFAASVVQRVWTALIFPRLPCLNH